MHVCSYICSFCYLGQSVSHFKLKYLEGTIQPKSCFCFNFLEKALRDKRDSIKIITAAANLSFLEWSSFANGELTEERINMLRVFLLQM